MTSHSPKTSSRILLRRIFLYVTILAFVFGAVDFFMTRYHYLNNGALSLEVKINKSRSPLKTWNTVEVDGSDFKYGETGILHYRPESLNKAILYGFYSKPGSSTKIIDCFIVLCIGLYFFIFSFFLSDKEFFNQKTYIMFVCLFFLAILLKEGRELVMSFIDDMFFQDTGNKFHFYTQTDGHSVFEVTMLFFILFNIIFGRALKVQKEQELTI